MVIQIEVILDFSKNPSPSFPENGFQIDAERIALPPNEIDDR